MERSRLCCKLFRTGESCWYRQLKLGRVGTQETDPDSFQGIAQSSGPAELVHDADESQSSYCELRQTMSSNCWQLSSATRKLSVAAEQMISGQSAQQRKDPLWYLSTLSEPYHLHQVTYP